MKYIHSIFSFLSILLIFCVISERSYAYVNRYAIAPAFNYYMVDESSRRTHVIGASFKEAFEFSLSNRTNIVFLLGFSKPWVLTTSDELNSQYFFILAGLLIKLYPLAEKQTQYLANDNNAILVENKTSAVNPYIAVGPATQYLLNDSGDASGDFVNHSLVGLYFAAGIDIPYNDRVGSTLETQTVVYLEPLSPNLLIFQFAIEMGFYINFF